MKLLEMFDKAIDGYQDTDSDNSAPKWHELRKTKLTLRQLRKLRRMLDVRNYERSNNLKKLRKQYAPAQAEGAITPGL
jgi:hypothetical protein